jgi:hypothetical protein
VFYVYAAPPGIWSGVFALSAGSIVIIVNLIKIEKITIESSKETDGQITFTSNRMGFIKKTITVKKSSVIYSQILPNEGNMGRWIILGIIFLSSFDVHIRIGLDLYPWTEIATLYLVSGVFTLSAAVIYLFGWNYKMHIVYNKDSTHYVLGLNIPKNQMNIINVIQNERVSNYGSAGFKEVLTGILIKQNAVPLFLGITFSIIGLITCLTDEVYLGEFTGIICWIFGLRVLSHLFVSAKSQIYSQNLPDPLSESKNDQDRKVGLRIEESIGLKNVSLVEMVCMFYLVIQSSKYLFYWVWFPDAGFIPLILGPALLLFAAVVVRIFQTKFISRFVIDKYKRTTQRLHGSLNLSKEFIATNKREMILNLAVIAIGLVIPFILYPMNLYYLIL